MEFIPVNFTAHNRHTWLSFAKRIRILSIKVRRWERSKKVTISKFQFGISRRHLEFEQNWASLFLLGLRSTNSESLRKIGLLGLKGLNNVQKCGLNYKTIKNFGNFYPIQLNWVTLMLCHRQYMGWSKTLELDYSASAGHFFVILFAKIIKKCILTELTKVDIKLDCTHVKRYCKLRPLI